MNRIMIGSRYVLSMLTVLLIFSCGSTKNVNTEAVTKTDTTISDAAGNYGLVVSFYSPGNGIDHKMKQEYAEFLTTNYPKTNYETIRWGKEGETDFCFQLNDLKENERELFVKESRELLSKSSRVHIYENVPCRNKKTND